MTYTLHMTQNVPNLPPPISVIFNPCKYPESFVCWILYISIISATFPTY